MQFNRILIEALTPPKLELLKVLNGDADNQLCTWDETQWRAVLSEAFDLQIAGIVYDRLKKEAEPSAIPPWVQNKLSSYYLHVLARNVRNREQLKQVLEITGEADIPVIVLKGMHLVEWVYGNPGVRPMVDMDLLFRLSDMGQAQCLVQEAIDHKELRPIPIDYHWNAELSSDSRIASEELWHHSEAMDLDGVAVNRLCKEDLLITLCSHVALHHHFHSNGLRCFWDIRTVLKKYHGAIDWPFLTQRAHAWRLLKTVTLTLHLVQKLFDVPVPLEGAKVWGQLAPTQQGRIVKSLFEQKTADRFLSPFFWRLFRPAPLSQKIRWCRKLLMPERAFISQKFPTSYGRMGNYFYYPVRMWAKSKPYIVAALKIIRRDPHLMPVMETELQDMSIKNWLVGIDDRPRL